MAFFSWTLRGDFNFISLLGGFWKSLSNVLQLKFVSRIIFGFYVTHLKLPNYLMYLLKIGFMVPLNAYEFIHNESIKLISD